MRFVCSPCARSIHFVCVPSAFLLNMHFCWFSHAFHFPFIWFSCAFLCEMHNGRRKDVNVNLHEQYEQWKMMDTFRWFTVIHSDSPWFTVIHQFHIRIHQDGLGPSHVTDPKGCRPVTYCRESSVHSFCWEMVCVRTKLICVIRRAVAPFMRPGLFLTKHVIRVILIRSKSEHRLKQHKHETTSPKVTSGNELKL